MARAVAKTGFTMVQDEIMARTDISLAAKFIGSYMARKAKGDSWYGGIRMLARMCAVPFSEARRGIFDLERAKLIHVHRGKRGQRSAYTLSKVIRMQITLAQKPSSKVSHSESLVIPQRITSDFTANHEREETYETKKKPPTPLGRGREGLPSSGTKGEKTDAMKPDALSEARRTALALFYPSNPPGTQRRYIEAYLRDLDGFSATSEQVQRRYDRWPEVFPNATCTLRALVKHWDALAPPPAAYDRWDGKPPTQAPRDED